MKCFKWWVLACAVGLVMGCGGASTEVAVEGEVLESSSQELAVCTALCSSGSVSCPTGTSTCTTTDYQGVTCDGVFMPCPSSPPGCIDDTPCKFVHRTECGEETRRRCCYPVDIPGSCVCLGRWQCDPDWP
jgi:hypothetical protein